MHNRAMRWIRDQSTAEWRVITLVVGVLGCPLLALAAQQLPTLSSAQSSASLLVSACEPLPRLSLAAVPAGSLTCAHAALVPPVATPAPSASRAGRGAAIGFLVGAAAGTVVAYVTTHQSRVTDHSEDGIAYVVFVPAGALIGLLFGLVVGATSTP